MGALKPIPSSHPMEIVSLLVPLLVRNLPSVYQGLLCFLLWVHIFISAYWQKEEEAIPSVEVEGNTAAIFLSEQSSQIHKR